MGGSPQHGREPGETDQEFNIRLQAEIRRLSTLLIDQGDPRITNGSGNQDPGPQADKASRSDKKHDNDKGISSETPRTPADYGFGRQGNDLSQESPRSSDVREPNGKKNVLSDKADGKGEESSWQTVSRKGNKSYSTLSQPLGVSRADDAVSR